MFLYEIIKMEEYVNHVGLSRRIKINKKNVTPQTIQSWFNHLKGRKFNYFHSIIFEKLGLTPVFVINDRPCGSPYILNSWKVCNLNRLKESCLNQYLIPTNQVDDFTVQKDKSKVYVLNSGFTFYVPFHKVVDKNGNFNPNNLNNNDIQDFAKRFRVYLKSLDKLSDSNALRKNPLLLPVIMESFQDNISSVQIWHSMKDKLHSHVWDYVSKKTRLTDEIGIRRIQEQIHKLNRELNYVVQQIEVDYPPLVKNAITLFFFAQFFSLEDIVQFASRFALSCIKLKIYPNKNHEVLMISHTNIHGVKALLSAVKECNIKSQRVMIADAVGEMRALDYARCFDPVMKQWASVRE